MGDGPGEWVAAARAAARFTKTMEPALAGVGLTLPQYRLLAFLSGGPERAAALAGRLDVTRPSLTALVDGAVARHLVERSVAADDRRGVRHVLTPAGLEALGRADAAVAARLAAVAGRLPPAGARRVLEGLELLGQALEAAAEERRADQERRADPGARPDQERRAAEGAMEERRPPADQPAAPRR